MPGACGTPERAALATTHAYNRIAAEWVTHNPSSTRRRAWEAHFLDNAPVALLLGWRLGPGMQQSRFQVQQPVHVLRATMGGMTQWQVNSWA